MNFCLKDMEFIAPIGTDNHERQIGAKFKVTVEFSADCINGAVSDDLSQTIDYQEVFDIVKAEMKKECQLVENAVYRIYKALEKRYPRLNALKVRLAKQRPPVNGILTEAIIELP